MAIVKRHLAEPQVLELTHSRQIQARTPFLAIGAIPQTRTASRILFQILHRMREPLIPTINWLGMKTTYGRFLLTAQFTALQYPSASQETPGSMPATPLRLMLRQLKVMVTCHNVQCSSTNAVLIT